ncbi:hypothetical protein PIB30_051299 [Stylosanthes scabra]|uniref:Pentatricopeptide repeat-containing protein n=1 Tax=Stylosanthes scabra TaxID=79078 RepID=A0ABU6YH70_9FABA|nr:hypothetical protein [Stylosanthes scabra]
MSLVFEMEGRDMVTWNSVIGGLVRGDGYAKAGEMEKTFEMFKEMFKRNVVLWSTIILGYCRARKNLVIWMTMIFGYVEKELVNRVLMKALKAAFGFETEIRRLRLRD